MVRHVPAKTARHVAANIRSSLCSAGPYRAQVIGVIHAASIEGPLILLLAAERCTEGFTQPEQRLCKVDLSRNGTINDMIWTY